jgi:cytochrome P450
MEDTFEQLARLRQESAVCEAGPGVHLVLRHAEAATALRDHRRFTGRLSEDDRSQRMLHELEIPDHPRVRGLLLFTGVARDAVARDAEAIRAIWDRLADELAARKQVDLVKRFTRPGVRASFALVAGIPEADRERVYGWVSDMREDAATSVPATRGRSSRASADAFESYILGEAQARRRASSPPDDLFTRLLFVEDSAGGTLSDSEIVMLMKLLCQAGIGSTSRSLGNLLYALIRKPDLYRIVRADRSLVAEAVEESLRHDPPGLLVERVCLQPTTLGGTRIAEGDTVVVNFGSANRDESIYSNPESFEPQRSRLNEHLSFGRGRHRCIGAPLARHVLRSALAAFLDHLPKPQLVPGFSYRPESFASWGPRELEVILS